MKGSVLLIVLGSLAAPAGVAGWIETRSGPFVVFSDAGEDRARQALYHLEQFRFIFGETLGRKDLQTVWPVTVVVTRRADNDPRPVFGFSRDGWLAAWPAGGAPGPEFFKKLGLLLIEDNWKERLPGELEDTLAVLFSTTVLQAGKVTLGLPPEPAARTRQWALLQYLLTNPETSGRTRVLLSNLAAGADEGAAFRNAFGLPASAFHQQVESYLAGGRFAVLVLPGRPINPELAFPVVPMMPSRLRVLPGDTLMARGADPRQIRAAYQQALNERPGPLAFEGLGLALLAEGAPEAARKAFQAMKAQLDPARDVCARGLLELGLFDEAAKQNPRWAEPYVRAAAREPGPVRKAYLLKKAAELEPRNPTLWQRLAQAQFAARQFADAERSWRAAERVARSAEERARMASEREVFEQARFEAEAAERARLQKEARDELERLRREALDNIRQAEEKASRGGLEGKKVEKWWEGPPARTFSGLLESVACQGARARLALRDEAGKPVSMVIADPNKVVVFGAGQTQAQLRCGPQKPPRRVKIEYVDRPGAAGEVVTLGFLP